jgi:hypothetical protein
MKMKTRLDVDRAGDSDDNMSLPDIDITADSDN